MKRAITVLCILTVASVRHRMSTKLRRRAPAGFLLLCAVLFSPPARAKGRGAADCAVDFGNGKAYFFKGAEYIRYDIAADRADPGFPRPIAGKWPGLWDRDIDAAFNAGNGKAYFFKGAEYIRYDIAADRADPGFPRPIAGKWPGLWDRDIDAAVGAGNGKAFFFKGAEYVRYDIAADRADPGFPRPIAGKWPGLWDRDIEIAFNAGNGKAYFFRSPLYARYDIVADRTDPNYPRPIADKWPGLWPVAGVAVPPSSCPDGQVLSVNDGICVRPMPPVLPPNAFPPSSPAAPEKAARDMTWQEACDTLVALMQRGEIQLFTFNTPKAQVPPEQIKACKDILPLSAPGSRITRIGLPLNGVRFVNISRNLKAPREDQTGYVDVRHAVLLYRLTRHLRDRWGANLFEHIGFDVGDFFNAHRKTWHDSGRMLDLAAVGGTLSQAQYSKPGAYKVRVADDWNSRTPRLAKSGRRLYRLAASPDRQADLAFRIFKDIYQFATRECSDTSDSPGRNVPLTDGAGRPVEREPGDLPGETPNTRVGGFICHPDHYGDSVAKAHFDHYHLQVGSWKAEFITRSDPPATPPEGAPLE